MFSHAGLLNTAAGSSATASPRSHRALSGGGLCIHALAARTRMPESAPLTATGMPTRKC